MAAGQPNVTFTAGYDAVGNCTSLTDNFTSVGRTTYAYDALDRLTTITRSLGGTAGPQVVFGYDAASRLTSLARTSGGSGTAVTTSVGYDVANRLTTLTHQTMVAFTGWDRWDQPAPALTGNERNHDRLGEMVDNWAGSHRRDRGIERVEFS